jgi:branched-chain amino acid transport system substrate-binding protein
MTNTGSRFAAVAAVLVALTACGGQQSAGPTVTDPGITATEIKIGATYPLSGSASFYYSVAKGALAYFAYVNAEKGGVQGRKINYVIKDDGYDSAKTPDKTRELIQDEKIFAAFGTLGTPNNKAVRHSSSCSPAPASGAQSSTSTRTPSAGSRTT